MFPDALRWYSGLVAAVALAVAGWLAVTEGLPPAVGVLVFAALVVFAEHGSVVLPNDTRVSASALVFMAAVVAFEPHGSILGPLLVGAAMGLHLPHLRRGRRGWIALNGGTTALAVAAAAAVYGPLADATRGSIPATIVLSLVPTAAYVLVSWLLLAASFVVDGSRSVRQVLAMAVPLVGELLPFAVLGFFLGRLYLEVGAAIVVLFVVPILIAREVFSSYTRLRDAHEETVRVLISALEAKDRYTAGHAERVARYAQYVGEELAFGPARLDRLRFAALMHDIGKLVVPNQLLNKPGRLTADEFARVRVHETVSVSILSQIDFLRPVAAAAHSDHTSFDPDDPRHPIEPYIVMVADAYDAMTSTRAYRRALSQEVAFGELRDKAGTQFHPDVVEALIRAIERRGEHHGAGFETEALHTRAPVAGLGSAGLGDLAPAATP